VSKHPVSSAAPVQRRSFLLSSAVVTASTILLSGPVAGQSPAAAMPYAVRVFADIADLVVGEDVTLIATSGWSDPGLGSASYAYDPEITAALAGQNPRWMVMTRNGRGFRLVAPKIQAECFGLSPRSADNSDALQAAIAMCAGSDGGQVLIPRGTFRFRKTVLIKAEVELIGSGKAGTTLLFADTGIALDAKGTQNNRIPFRVCDLTLAAMKPDNNTQAVRLAWNQRSTPLLERVRISGFGHYAINFAGSNWIVTFRDVEIHDCAKIVPGSSAIWRDPDPKTVEGLADIKFFGLVIESCGNAKSKAGAIHFAATTPGSTQGLWLYGATIENNAGSFECAFQNVDHLSIDQSYFEITFQPGQPRSAIDMSGGRLNLTGCRMASDPGNKSANIIRARNGAVVLAAGNTWDSDFGGADVSFDATATMEGADFQRSGQAALRLTKVKAPK
jgi:Pectate lyase superfamily protein